MSPSPVLPKIHSVKIGEKAYKILRERIISRELTPGQRLDLGKIESQLGISRTPLKEALNRLALEGLVEIVARRGTYVTDPTAEEIAESFEVRKALEIYAVGWAVEQATDEELRRLGSLVEELGEMARAEDWDALYPRYMATDHQFHRELVGLSGNERLMGAHERENVHAQMARVRHWRSEKEFRWRELNLAQEEHERMMAALEARDRARAEREMAAHLKAAKCSLLEDMARQHGSDASHPTPDHRS